jgi:phage tail sheath gpL-like
MVAFNNIPANARVPGFYVEFDPSKANSFSGGAQRALIIAQGITAGIATRNVARIVEGLADAKQQGGAGSMFALMVERYRKADPDGELWGVVLDDDAAAVAATGTVAFTSAATASGTLAFYVGDVRVPILVTSAMTTAQLATALAAAVNALTDLPVTAAAVATTVTFTAKNKGSSENDISLAFNVGGALSGEILPIGLAATITAMSGGTTNPVLTTALANLLDQPFDAVIVAGTDTVTLDALKDFFSDTTGRWSFNRQVYGHGFIAYRGTLGAATTLGAARNDPHVSILPMNNSPTPHWLVAPTYAAADFRALKADPARPSQTLTLPGMAAPPLASRFAWADQQALLFAGMSTYSVDDDGTVRLQNVITTYQKNSFNQPDDSYLEIETPFQLMYLMRDLRMFCTQQWPRAKLGTDGVRYAPGVDVVTPGMVKAGIIGRYKALERDGKAQGSDIFAQLIVVQRNSTNPNRLDIVWPGELMNQLRIFAVLAQFRLSSIS